MDPWGLAVGDEFRDLKDFEYVKIQLMKIIANKAYYEEATRDSILNGTDRELHKQNLSSWASNERAALLDYMAEEFAGEDIYNFFYDVLMQEGGATIEETSALLCVVANYEAEIDVLGQKKEDINPSYGNLYNTYKAAVKDGVVYYVDLSNIVFNQDAANISIDDIGTAYLGQNKSTSDVGGYRRVYDTQEQAYKYYKPAYVLNDQDDKSYAPESA